MTPSINDIIETTRAYYGIDRKSFLSRYTGQHIARPRHIAMYLSRTLTNHSLPKIGQQFSDRDHTTILHGYRRVLRFIVDEDHEIIDAVSEIEVLAKERASNRWNLIREASSVGVLLPNLSTKTTHGTGGELPKRSVGVALSAHG